MAKLERRQKKRAAILCCCAAVLLVSWIAATVLCSFICLCPDSTDGHHEHAEQAESGHSHENDGGSDSERPDTPEFCASLDSTHFIPSNQVLPKFKVEFIMTVDLSSLLPQNPIDIENAFSGRQAKKWIWVFTPEVCLGPAIRSLAPPYSSLS